MLDSAPFLREISVVLSALPCSGPPFTYIRIADTLFFPPFSVPPPVLPACVEGTPDTGLRITEAGCFTQAKLRYASHYCRGHSLQALLYSTHLLHLHPITCTALHPASRPSPSTTIPTPIEFLYHSTSPSPRSSRQSTFSVHRSDSYTTQVFRSARYLASLNLLHLHPSDRLHQPVFLRNSWCT